MVACCLITRHLAVAFDLNRFSLDAAGHFCSRQLYSGHLKTRVLRYGFLLQRIKKRLKLVVDAQLSQNFGLDSQVDAYPPDFLVTLMVNSGN